MQAKRLRERTASRQGRSLSAVWRTARPTLPIGGSFGQGFFMNSTRELVTDPEEIKKEMAGFSDGWTLNILAEGGISTNLNGYQLICYGIGSTPGASLSAGWTFYEGSKDDF